MRTPWRAQRSAGGFRGPGAMAFLTLAVAGCAGIGGSSGAGTGGGTADGGSSDAGGSGGSSSSGGAQGSGGSTASGGAHGSGGSTGGGTGGASTSTGGSSGAGGRAGGPCTVTLTPLAPASSFTVEVGPTATLQIQGVVMNARVASPTWRWTVTSPTLTTVAITKQDDRQGPPPSSVVTFPVTMLGTYQILAQASDASCGPSQPLLITGAVSKPSFTLRVTAAGFPVQEKRITPSVSSSMVVALDQGGTYTIQPRQAGQLTVMPAYVRITSPATTFDVEGYTSHGAVKANLISNFVYDLLVVPDDPTFAPDLFRSVLPDVWSQPITFDQGTPVSGLVLGPDGAPLANARLILKLDGRPSTVGTSDASGALTMWTRPGNMSAIVVPPDGTGLPQANVTANSGSGVSLGSSDSSLSLKMEYQPTSTGRLTVTVRDVNGAGAIAGARVRLSSHGDVPSVGLLTSKSSGGPSMSSAATGSISTEAVSDANGDAKLGSLPAGPYDVVIVPPASSAGAITDLALDALPASGTSTVSLARKVKLTGTLAPPAGSGSTSGVAGASITALDKTGDVTGSVVSATADATGSFALQVDPDRKYQLIIQPLAGQALGRTVVPLAVGATEVKVTLPPGVTFTGTVAGEGSHVGGAFLQVFCVPSATWCPDSTVSLAEATTRPDGSFSFILPNPTP